MSRARTTALAQDGVRPGGAAPHCTPRPARARPDSQRLALTCLLSFTARMVLE